VALGWPPVSTDGRQGGVGGRGGGGRRGARGDGLGPRPVVASLAEATRMMGLEGAVELAEVQAHWVEVVGEAVAVHAWPTALRQGVLTIAVDHHAWAAQLRLLSSHIVHGLQVPCPTVQAVAIQVSLTPAPRPE
jgi:predicted nucleic acid-binding Zn ribbon protein